MTIEKLNQLIEKSRNHPETQIKVRAGYYFCTINGKTYDIERQPGWAEGRGWHGFWFINTDGEEGDWNPTRTLKQAIITIKSNQCHYS